MKNISLVAAIAGLGFFYTGVTLAEEQNPSPVPISVDLAFLFDRSGSFNDDLETFRTHAARLTNIEERATDLAVGLSSFVDAPCGDFGFRGDFGYQQEMALTKELTMLPKVLKTLYTLDGNDAPESQLEAMKQALTGQGVKVNRGVHSCEKAADIASSNMGWRSKTLKFLFVSTDSKFHQATDYGYPYATNSDEVIQAAQDLGARVFFLFSTDGKVVEPEADKIAQATGGAVSLLSSNSEHFADVVTQHVFHVIDSLEIQK